MRETKLLRKLLKGQPKGSQISVQSLSYHFPGKKHSVIEKAVKEMLKVKFWTSGSTTVGYEA